MPLTLSFALLPTAESWLVDNDAASWLVDNAVLGTGRCTGAKAVDCANKAHTAARQNNLILKAITPPRIFPGRAVRAARAREEWSWGGTQGNGRLGAPLCLGGRAAGGQLVVGKGRRRKEWLGEKRVTDRRRSSLVLERRRRASVRRTEGTWGVIHCNTM